jgi:hypothetical protein
MTRNRPTALVYFAPVKWDSYQQRPHYVVRHFLASHGSRAVWVDPYPIRFPRVADIRRFGQRLRLPVERPPNLTVLRFAALPLEPLGVGRWLNQRFVSETTVRRLRNLIAGHDVIVGIGHPSLVALSALTALDPAASFYDAMDDFPEFYSGRTRLAVRAREAEIARAVNLVVTSSSALWTKFETVGRRRLMVQNSFEMSALPSLSPVRNGRDVFGYVGCVGTWFDWSIIIGLAQAFPTADVHVVGPRFEQPWRALPPNVHLFPACALPRAIEHCQRFSVGLIPFKRTPLTQSVDPIKYYGYRGMGLPVLATKFGEMANRGVEHGAYIIDDVGSLETVAASALAAPADSAAIAEFRRTYTWERRFEETGLFDRLFA